MTSEWTGGKGYPVGAGGRGLSQGIPSANTRVATPLLGVTPTEIKRARNNSGSNIRIPYARVVPTSGVVGANSGSRDDGSALQSFRHADGYDRAVHPQTVLGTKEKHGVRQSKVLLNESEQLSVGDLVFVRGQTELKTASSATTRSLGEGYDADHMDSLTLHKGFGTDKLSRLCTFEYLTRFFETKMHHVQLKIPPGLMAGVSPFLTGLTTSSDRSSFGEALQHCSSCAFQTLMTRMGDAGLLTWTPDGIVVGKDHVADEATDEEFDNRLGQLFNVAVQGPATTTEYCHRQDLAGLPNDCVFVLVVADVVEGHANPDNGHNKTAYNHDTAGTKSKEKLAEEKAEWLLTARCCRNPRKEGMTVSDAAQDYVDERLAIGKDVRTKDAACFARHSDNAKCLYLENFRVQLSSSAHMIRTSGYGMGATARDVLQGKKASSGTTCMKLQRGEKRSEYVLGGWSIGHILDSAATRPFVGMPISVVRHPLSSSLNVFVNVKWWTGSMLHETFYNPAAILTTGYETLQMSAHTALTKRMQKLLADVRVCKDLVSLKPTWYEDGDEATGVEATGVIPQQTVKSLSAEENAEWWLRLVSTSEQMKKNQPATMDPLQTKPYLVWYLNLKERVDAYNNTLKEAWVRTLHTHRKILEDMTRSSGIEQNARTKIVDLERKVKSFEEKMRKEPHSESNQTECLAHMSEAVSLISEATGLEVSWASLLKP